MQPTEAQRHSTRSCRPVILVAFLFALANADAAAGQTPEQEAALETDRAHALWALRSLETDPPILANIYGWSGDLFTVIYRHPRRRAQVDAAITEIITAGGRPAFEYDGMPSRFTAARYAAPEYPPRVPLPHISAIVLAAAHPLIEVQDYGLHFCTYFVEARFGQWPFDPYAILMGMYRRRYGDPIVADVVATGLPVPPIHDGQARSTSGDTYEDVRRVLRRRSGDFRWPIIWDQTILYHDLRRLATNGFVVDTFHILGWAFDVEPGPRRSPCSDSFASVTAQMNPIRAPNIDPTDGFLVVLR